MQEECRKFIFYKIRTEVIVESLENYAWKISPGHVFQVFCRIMEYLKICSVREICSNVRILTRLWPTIDVYNVWEKKEVWEKLLPFRVIRCDTAMKFAGINRIPCKTRAEKGEVDFSKSKNPVSRAWIFFSGKNKKKKNGMRKKSQ